MKVSLEMENLKVKVDNTKKKILVIFSTFKQNLKKVNLLAIQKS